jgi:Transglutaminase-like superfamily
MKPLFSLVGLLVLGTLISLGQMPPSQGFEQFAENQEGLFLKAYEDKNIQAYHKLLNEFIIKYNKLDIQNQKKFSERVQNAFYNLSCIYSLLDKRSEALLYLEKAIGAGASNYSHMQKDVDLDNIRAEKRFTELLEPLRLVGDYLYILKRGENYDPNDKRELPPFTYQPANHPKLTALRIGFNLDSIAGEANELAKIINLMHWIHNLVPHDGNHPNPTIKNAMNMIAVCKKEKRGLNCRGLATLLNECYLAMGFKSRLVTCLPKDSLQVDPDCHVINSVYATILKKWIWMDPTNDAYVMNGKGELLSIEEVRNSIISGQPLILNPGANWNNKVSKTTEDYLYHYMAKNLYILQCPVNSEYDAETAEPGKVISYISLVPLDYFNRRNNVREEINDISKSGYRFYQTNNPVSFWRLPGAR